MKHYRVIGLALGIAGMLAVSGCSKTAATSPFNEAGSVSASGEQTEGASESTEDSAELEELVRQADVLAAGYDYDSAIALLQDVKGYASNAMLKDAVSRYKKEKSQTVLWADNKQVPHIFFHTLVPNTDLAFDGDYREAGYNQVMTTVDEFDKIMEQMYERGWVLVTPYQLYKMEEVTEDVVVQEAYTDEDGQEVPAVTEKQTVTKMVKQDIYLPEGKKPFVLSQDDVCYYEYMEGDGFPSRLVIGADGKIFWKNIRILLIRGQEEFWH